MKQKIEYKIDAKLYISEFGHDNTKLPSPLWVMACFENNTSLNKFIDNKIISLCKQYNYNGKVIIFICTKEHGNNRSKFAYKKAKIRTAQVINGKYVKYLPEEE